MNNLPEPIRRLCAAASVVVAGLALFGLFTRTVSRELAELKTGAGPALPAAIATAPGESDSTLSPAAGITESVRSAVGFLGRLEPGEQAASGFWTALGARRDAAVSAAGEIAASVAEWMRGLTAREVTP